MIQTGDPTGTGKGGQSIYGKAFDDEIVPEIKHERGTLSMANKGPGTNGSQFFFSYATLPYLDKKYTIFGRVIYGLEILAKMEKVDVTSSNKPVADIKITSVTIHANPLADS
eukprot:TRINITY_DN1691_c0_g1_i1.p1 TRINITY_DN1691_c0_g1~~TRINITY_DN1691_c0_g1_i1.p1  ORF type:complete len:112 (-),score=17.75 TRINITY_DN1691_c0_g1_i1:115-450(-)